MGAQLMNKFRLVVWSLNWVVALVCGFIGIIWYLDASRLYWLELAGKNPMGGLLLFLVAMTRTSPYRSRHFATPSSAG
ncbi:MAG: hypothetical protein AMK75_01205 [Planctomycetes bacterium SM23_65]|nr:MAG: hypothetical protein AMK75_01205 [Planctomycetes bacterium SM23_65]